MVRQEQVVEALFGKGLEKTLLITAQPGAAPPAQALADSFCLIQPKLAAIALLLH